MAGIDDIGKSRKLPKYDRKNLIDAEKIKLPDDDLRTKQTGGVGVIKPSVSAQKALGAFDSVPVSGGKTAGAKNASAGIGLLQGIKRNFTKGLLTALIGITVLQSVSTNVSIGTLMEQDRSRPVAAETYKPGPGTTAAQLRMGGFRGERALSDAQQVLARFGEEAQLDSGFEVHKLRAAELVAAALLPARAPDGANVFEFAKGKLGTDTQQLIATVLDGSSLKLSADARDLLSMSIGRVQVVSNDGKVVVTGDQKDGFLRLRGAAGAQVEVLNLSTIPSQRIRADESFVIGSVGADGTFAGKLDMQEGDVIRLRLKSADGTATEWVDLKATGVGVDQRPADVALFRIGLTDNKDGTVSVSNINSSRPVSEPGAMMRFINARTQEQVDVTFNKNGTFPDGVKLPGKTGDQYSVRLTDGTHDKELAKEIAVLNVREPGKPSVVEGIDLPDPTLHADELDSDGKPRFSLERFRGPLFESAATFTDPTQGQIGDCYFPAAISAIAFHAPGTFEKMMTVKQEVDPTTGQTKVWYEVTFKKYDYQTRKYVDDVQKVDGDLYIRHWGGPLYGSDDGVRSPEDMELWFAILEKAYAQWKGDSYDAIGNGGMVNEVFKDILGGRASSHWMGDADTAWDLIKGAVDGKRPIGAGTHGHDQDAIYANTGVYSNHAYSILAYQEVDGVKMVQLRNPWGESEPSPGDGKNDGVFWLKLDDFTKLYATIYSVDKP